MMTQTKKRNKGNYPYSRMFGLVLTQKYGNKNRLVNKKIFAQNQNCLDVQRGVKDTQMSRVLDALMALEVPNVHENFLRLLGLQRWEIRCDTITHTHSITHTHRPMFVAQIGNDGKITAVDWLEHEPDAATRTSLLDEAEQNFKNGLATC